MNTPHSYILFGATGDLAQRKIVPAIASLFVQKRLPENFRVIAFSRRAWVDEDYRTFITPSVESVLGNDVEKFLECITYVQGVFDENNGFNWLKSIVGDNHAFIHLAIQPEFYASVIEQLNGAGIRGTIMIEKPFGHDLISAEALEARIEKYTSPEHIFRIDHYLGKQGLLKMLEVRIGDTELERKLNSQFVKAINIHFFETLDVHDRGEFYDAVGATRDVVQNHCLSMLATLLMDLEEAKYSEESARATVLRALTQTHNITRGQYKGYKDAHGVATDSETETYISFTTECTLPRWNGIPITISAGKALSKKQSEITVLFIDGTKKVFDMELLKLPDAYETIIAAMLRHDMNLSQGFGEIRASWLFIDSLRAQFEALPLVEYESGSARIEA